MYFFGVLKAAIPIVTDASKECAYFYHRNSEFGKPFPGNSKKSLKTFPAFAVHYPHLIGNIIPSADE